jgi:spermidine/putrescine transport system ATP-binding protein
MSSRGGHVELLDLVKRFGDVVAVAGIDLDISSGEFFSLLGPSGCGKTTTLRLIGGFERPTSGRILLDGVDMAQTPPHRRNVNTVFQSYALFPHLSVGDNVAFGLRFQNLSAEERRRQVADVLTLVQLAGFQERKPNQLSGGQQQRVALARALILNPAVLLLDEPLGALDAKLRKALQIELKALQEEIGITFIYVTHDQEEALTMSDRLAVMSEGKIEQIGPPKQVYEEPRNVYVADFLGVSNLMDAVAEGGNGAGSCRVRLGESVLDSAVGDTGARGPVKVVIRPERVLIEERDAAGSNAVPGMVERVVYVGPVIQMIVRLAPGESIQAMVPNRGGGQFTQGTPVMVRMPPDALRILEGRRDVAAEGGRVDAPEEAEDGSIPAPMRQRP